MGKRRNAHRDDWWAHFLQVGAMTSRHSDRSLWRPSLRKSGCNKVPTAADQRGPLGEVARDAIHCDVPHPTRTRALLFRRGPSAIARLVVAVAIDTVNRVPWRRAVAHVVDECFKAAEPSVTDANAAATVSVVARVLRMAASALHALPDAILRRIGHAMCAGAFPALLFPNTAARLRVASLQVQLPRRDGCAAVALAHPPRLVVPALWRLFSEHQPPKSFPGKQGSSVLHIRHYTPELRVLVVA